MQVECSFEVFSIQRSTVLTHVRESSEFGPLITPVLNFLLYLLPVDCLVTFTRILKFIPLPGGPWKAFETLSGLIVTI